MTEASIVAAIKRHLKNEGWAVWKNHGSQYSDKGLPDLMAGRQGVFVAFEVKRPGKGPTDSQRKWIERLRLEGFIAAVVHSVDEVKEQLEGLTPQEASP
jgi:hypothetical protein